MGPQQKWADAVEMTWTFKYILDGLAIQDETLKADGAHSGSIRQFNEETGKWYVHYYATSSVTASLNSWEGGLNEQKDKIVLYKPQKAPNGMDGMSRLTFYNFSDGAEVKTTRLLWE